SAFGKISMHSEATDRKGAGINADVLTSLCRISFFPENKLLLHVVGPVVDTTGKLESKASALLCDNVDKYHDFEGKFAEISLNALKYWEELALPPSQYPLISVAIRIFSMVPHAGVVEISKLKQLVAIKRKGGGQDELETQTIEEIELMILQDYNELDIIGDLIGDLEEALKLKKAKEEMAKATRLGREHLPRPSDRYDLIAYDAMFQNGTLAMTKRPSLSVKAPQIQRPGMQTKFFK
ncbi:hypothetical protein BT69DRAFT_1306165, partial [Atractiella rhizophila]